MADLLVNFDAAVDQSESCIKDEGSDSHHCDWSQSGVRETIQELHQRGFAHIDAWSKILPIPGEGQLIVNDSGS